MLLVISPAKNLDYESPLATKKHTQPDFLDQSQLLIDELRHLAPQDISKLMHISDKLGVLNYDRFQQWAQPFDAGNARPAVLAFNGDVYSGLDAPHFKADDFNFAQKHLRILSGLYGLLKPLDLMQPYRLEMGTKFANQRGANLYDFWGERITDALNAQLKSLKSEVLVNLASNEYFKSVKPKALQAEVITPVFKDWKGDQYKIISFYAKKARGLMCAYAIKNRITDPQQLKQFDSEGYAYNEAMSSDKEWVFIRRQPEA
ncbi:peroxide stress protein YaaA [Pseudomaricurvus sp. HS19]|uniref:peroxide stress protein YaaA n=1 Tax=Pseudomaricurvus sp. HS19 TaxID=2692626 RepID=UPI00136A5D70|nr:peroxide stress protein YaaA [Pseudomaricurvus sp. HS19]MYM63816.1 peroxide stress protein YaaA [Pseudomaricurvus sp. HS19]